MMKLRLRNKRSNMPKFIMSVIDNFEEVETAYGLVLSDSDVLAHSKLCLFSKYISRSYSDSGFAAKLWRF